MAKPKFGFHYSRIENVIPPPDFAHLAEEMEFDSVWVPEALVNEVPAGDIMMTMSALVHHSSSITVGAGAVLLPLRNPVVLAKEFATLDIHSEGRIIIGFGVGGPPDSHPDAFEACGVSMRERGNLTDEALEIMTKLWTGEAVDHQGKFQSFSNIHLEPRPYQRPHPPLWAGGVSERMLKRAARYADGFYPVRINAEEFAVSWSKITRYGEELGRDVSGMSRAIHLFYRIGSTREEALTAGETELNRRRGFEVSLVNDGRYAFGTVDDCTSTVERFLDAGVDQIVFNAMTPADEVPEQLNLLVDGVISRFR